MNDELIDGDTHVRSIGMLPRCHSKQLDHGGLHEYSGCGNSSIDPIC